MEYRLKEGVELRPYGPTSLVNNDNLTDEIAVYLLETGKAQPSDFENEPTAKKRGKNKTETTNE